MDCIRDAEVRDMILLASDLESALAILTSTYSCLETMKHELKATIRGAGLLTVGKHKDWR